MLDIIIKAVYNQKRTAPLRFGKPSVLTLGLKEIRIWALRVSPDRELYVQTSEGWHKLEEKDLNFKLMEKAIYGHLTYLDYIRD